MSETSKVDDFMEDMRARIDIGEFGIGGRLPSLAALTKEYRISLDTVRRGLYLLAGGGLLAHKGRDYYVDRVERVIRTNSGVSTFEHSLKAAGENYLAVPAGEPEVIRLPPSVARLCGIAECDVVHRSYVRGTDERHYEVADYWYPTPEAIRFLPKMAEDTEGNYLDEIMRMREVSSVVAEELVLTRIATSREVELLGILKYSSVLESLIKCVEPSGTTLCIMKIVSINAVVHRYVYPYAIS